MSFLRNWIVNIISIIIIACLIDLLLPNSNMRKYVKFFSGLILMIVILNPIMKLLNLDIKYQNFEIQSASLYSIESEAEELGYAQMKMAIELYQNKLINQIETIVKDIIEIDDVKVEIKFSDLFWSGQINEIQKIDIYLINQNNQTITELQRQKIKQSVSEICDINYGQINIYIQ